MSKPAIKIQNLSKQYRLGTVGTGTLSHDLKRWWTMNIQGKDDPNLKIGELNDRSVKANSDYVWALKDINLEIEQGDIVGIIGKNGAGKSTLLKILSRVTSPTTGSVEYSGRMASLLEVGTGFHAEMTGRENIFMNGSIMGMTKAEIKRKLDEIIDFAGIEKYIDTPVKRYSSGMTVRLGFSIAAHLEPEILIVDEVLAVGDAEFQKKAIGKMQDVSKGEGRTVLFVSHNMAAIKNLCRSSILLNNGVIQKFGDVSSVINSYLLNFVKENKSVSYSVSEAPGNSEVKLLHAEVNSINDPIQAGDEVIFDFKFNHKTIEIARYDVTIHLSDEMNNLVFVGSTAFEINELIVEDKSLFICSCSIPPNLLNTGTFTISRLLYVRNVGQVVCEFRDVLCFEVVEKSNSFFGWQGAKEGVVRPKLNWKVNMLK